MIIDKENRSFLKVFFANKGIDAINLSNILHNKKVVSKIPSYFQDKSPPILSYTYSKSIASTIFNYKKVLQEVQIKDIKSKPPSCTCSTSPHCYQPVNHIITGDLSIIPNNKLRDLFFKGPKFRPPRSINWRYNFKLLMDSVEEYARRWAKREKVDVNTLSEWIKTIRTHIQSRIKNLKNNMSNRVETPLKDAEVKKCLAELHHKYIVLPADKAPNNIVFVCKKYYHECMLKELNFDESQQNGTYTPTCLSRQEIFDNHRSVLNSFGIKTEQDDLSLPSLYWIPKLHKTPYKCRFIAGSAKCTTKGISKILTSLLTAIKEGIQKYCNIAFSHSGVNQMWILKNSKSLLESLKCQSCQSLTSISTFDFSTLYTTIPHDKLKARLACLVKNSFFYKNGKRRYRYLVLNNHTNSAYFVKEHTDSTQKYTEDNIINMLNFLIDNIFVEYGGIIFQQTIGIPMGTNCAPLLADLFLYTYEAEFIQKLVKSKKKNLAQSFNFTFRYIDDVLSLSNAKFEDHLHLIYPNELEIKNTTDTIKSASYLDLFIQIDRNGHLSTKLYDKRDDFNFPIVNFPFLSSNIPSSPAYGVYMSQLIRYSRACTFYKDFISRGKILTSKLMQQGFLKQRLITVLKKFYGRCPELINSYHVSISQIIIDIFAD